MKGTIFSAAIFVTIFSGLAQAAPPETPPSLAGVETVDNDHVKKALAARTSLLVDFRPAAHFTGETLPGGLHCPGVRQEPTELTDAEITAAIESVSGCKAVMATPKDREVIAFCGSERCWVSPKAAMALSRLGFTKVKWLRGGIDGWKAAGGQMQ